MRTRPSDPNWDSWGEKDATVGLEEREMLTGMIIGVWVKMRAVAWDKRACGYAREYGLSGCVPP